MNYVFCNCYTRPDLKHVYIFKLKIHVLYQFLTSLHDYFLLFLIGYLCQQRKIPNVIICPELMKFLCRQSHSESSFLSQKQLPYTNAVSARIIPVDMTTYLLNLCLQL